MQMSLSQVAAITHGALIGQDQMFSNVSTDSRTLKSGDLFIALSGDNFDGHTFVEAAAQQGACGVVVERQLNNPIPQVKVANVLKALGDLAHAWRMQINPKVIALTGSNGKTTLKEMLAAILAPSFHLLATQGNLNNDIGVPLTLLRLQDEALAVIEMGANHLGEIDYLSNMAKPDIAILNNAGLAHVGEFGSAENIGRGKAEIINGLSADGVFIYHADSRWVGLWQQLSAAKNSISFGFSENADYQLLKPTLTLQKTDQGFVSAFSVVEKQTATTVDIELQLAGWHNAMNALAAIATARQLGLSFEQIKQGLAQLPPVKGRLHSMAGNLGQWLIDDSYNANPDSVKAAIDVLAAIDGKRLLVLGELAELGEQADNMLADIGQYARDKNIDAVLTVGQKTAAAASAAFGYGGLHFDNQQALITHLQQIADADQVILVKGSRAAKMEKVIKALVVTGEGAC